MLLLLILLFLELLPVLLPKLSLFLHHVLIDFLPDLSLLHLLVQSFPHALSLRLLKLLFLLVLNHVLELPLLDVPVHHFVLLSISLVDPLDHIVLHSVHVALDSFLSSSELCLFVSLLLF